MSCKNAICVLEAGHAGVCAATFLEARMMKDLARAHARILALENSRESDVLHAHGKGQESAAEAEAELVQARAERARLRTVLAAVVKAHEDDDVSDETMFEVMDMAHTVLDDMAGVGVAQDQTLSEGELARARASLDPMRAIIDEREAAYAKLATAEIECDRLRAEVERRREQVAAIEERERLTSALEAENEGLRRDSREHAERMDVANNRALDAEDERDRLRAVLATTAENIEAVERAWEQAMGVTVSEYFRMPGTAVLAALRARAGVERVSCGEAHPQQDVFHPGGHVKP